MKKKRKISLFALTILMFSLLFAGCGNAVKQAGEVYCEMIFKSDSADIQKLGMSESEKDEFVSAYQGKIKDQLKSNLQAMMGYSATDEQLTAVCDGYTTALAKITYDVKEVSKSGDAAEVEVSTTHFDLKEIDEQAAMDALDETDTMTFATMEEENNKFAEVYLNKLAEGLKNTEVNADEKNSNTFKFKKVDGHWKAEDDKNFGYKLVQLAVNAKNMDLNIDEESVSPEESAEILWNLVIKQDSSAMEKLGYSEAFGKRIIKNINKSDFDAFKQQFNQSGVTLSDEQIQGIIDSLRAAMNKSTVTFEQVSKTDTMAQVKVSATSISMNAIVKQALNNTKSQAISGGVTDEQKIVELYAANIIDVLNNTTLSETSNQKSFSFRKMADIWMPANVTSFSEGIVTMVIR